MHFPAITAATAGFILLLQMFLAVSISLNRGKISAALGDGGDHAMFRMQRRHANIAENSGIFIAGFTLLELSSAYPQLLQYLCALFILVRIMHAIGLSQASTMNLFRMIGGMGTYLLGLILGGTLLRLAIPVIFAGN